MSSDLATDLQHGRPRDLGGARGEHRCDGNGFESLDHVGPGHPLVGQRLERGADAASLMERTSTAGVAAPPAVVDVLGDVGEEREPRECPDHVECVFDAEVAQCGAQLVSRIAAHHPRTDGGASDPLDQFERRRTGLGRITSPSTRPRRPRRRMSASSSSSERSLIGPRYGRGVSGRLRPPVRAAGLRAAPLRAQLRRGRRGRTSWSNAAGNGIRQRSSRRTGWGRTARVGRA